MDLIKSVTIADDGRVGIELRLTSPFCEMIAFPRNESLVAIDALPGVTGVTVHHDAGLDWDHDRIAPAADGGSTCCKPCPRPMPQPSPQRLIGGTAGVIKV